MEQTVRDIEEDMGLFTLEDAYENLKDVRAELEHEVDDLVDLMANNEFGTLMDGGKQDDIRNQHHKLMRGLLKIVHHQEPRVLPHANTIDLQYAIVHDFMDVLRDVKKIVTSIKNDSKRTRKHIAHLRSNKEGLEKMKTACQGAVENVGTHTTYRKEIEITKRMFAEVKEDLFICVDTIFPDNIGFKDLLANLTRAYTSGGDEVWIDVEPENLTFAKFLIEADLAVYHRNDKSKIKMTDLL